MRVWNKQKMLKYYRQKKSDYNETIGQTKVPGIPNIAKKKGSLFQMVN